MRKKEREITDRREIERVLTEAKVLRLAINEAGAPPYIVPVNFGYRDGAVYFHSSYEGKKIELITKDPMVSFEAETDVAIIAPADPTNACEWGVAYRSVIGHGRARLLVDDGEKRAGLLAIMAGVAPEIGLSALILSDKIMKITAVVKIEIEAMTGKKHRV
ncbi:MAG: pyridoxamine 5'-phosphate oxidase family protein [Deltaproteobacteria bacterium]|nr:pyridoxamine 5'-phosphate oxidase family protein [Candidatus Zymogenaceae bacterium]